jgi:branched-chain amino acid transport system permease protein
MGPMIWPWGLGTTSYKLAVIGAAVALLCAVWVLMTRTRIGLVMRATQADREMALAFGIPVERVYAGVFGLGAALAALAGVLIVPIQQAHYLMGADPLLLSFIVVIIGGLGSLPGTVLIGLSDGIISVFFSPTLAKILATLLVGLVLVFRPQGLFGARGA